MSWFSIVVTWRVLQAGVRCSSSPRDERDGADNGVSRGGHPLDQGAGIHVLPGQSYGVRLPDSRRGASVLPQGREHI